MLATIINKLTGIIVIEVTPGEFRFSRRGLSTIIKTYIYLFEDKGEYRILSVGEGFEGSKECIRVELFSEKLPPNNLILRSDLLEAFLRYGLWKIFGRRMFLRPTILFKGTKSIEKILAGYQNIVLTDAAYKAGAHSVKMEK